MKPNSAMPLILLAVLLTVLLAACGGNTASKADSQKPTVRITSSATSATSGYSLEGVIVDNVGVDTASYSLNDGEAQELQLTDDAFSTTITLRPGPNSISVTATDKAGNTGEDSTSVTYNAPPAGVMSSSGIARPGSTLTVSGSNLGTSGSINLGGMTITPSTWTDTQITLTIPADAPAGPQELTITTDAGSETLELFVGVDFPAGTLEQLVALKLPKGTAVRLGEGTFESTSALLTLDNLSFYGQGESRTTLKATGSGIDARFLIFNADAEFNLILTDLTLEADATAIFPAPPEMPEDFTISNASAFEALSSLAADPQALMGSLLAEAGGSFTTASYGVDFGSYELRNVTIPGGLPEGGMITVGFLVGIDSTYMGHLVFDNVSFDSDENILYLTSADTIEIRHSTLNLGYYTIGSLSGKVIIDESRLTSNGDSGNNNVLIMGARGLELTNSEFTAVDAELDFWTIPEDSWSFTPSESVIRNNKITSRETIQDMNTPDGMINMLFAPITAVVEKNIFTAEKGVYFYSDGGQLTISDNAFTVGHADLTHANGISIESDFNTFVAFNNNEAEFLSTGNFSVRGNDNFIVNHNVINGFDNTGTALLAAQRWSGDPLSISAQRNTFAAFGYALLLDVDGPDDGVFKARINNNVFDFPINSASQAAILWDLAEANADLDATNNVWGTNTSAADVQSYVSYEGWSDPGVLKVDPITLP